MRFERAPPRVERRLGVVGLWTEKGLAIDWVEPDSPAERAGLRAGDLLLGLDGRWLLSLDTDAGLSAVLGGATSVRLLFERNEELQEAQAELGPP